VTDVVRVVEAQPGGGRTRRPDLLEAAAGIVAVDPTFADVVGAVRCDLRRSRPGAEHFGALVRSICYQQLAGAAAATIAGRVAALVGEHPRPADILAVTTEELRACGLSGSKAASIQDLAQKVAAGEVRLDGVGRLGDEEVVAELVKVRGIGPWTAHMFLMFTLGRLDVWPVDDYGVRKGWAVLHGLSDLPPPKVLLEAGEVLRPWRSVAAWYCWRAADTVTL
jgi:DNA-3-methyladenine glycosylase II